MKVGRDEAELRSKVEDIPIVTAEDANGGRCVPVVGHERAILMCQESNERRLPSAVGTDNRGVFANPDRERQAVENGTLFPNDCGVRELEDGIRHCCKCKVESGKWKVSSKYE